jgi:hypothetical protein
MGDWSTTTRTCRMRITGMGIKDGHERYTWLQESGV